MNKIALGLAAVLLSTTAYAQSNNMNMDAGASAKPNMMLKKQGGDGGAEASGKADVGKTEATGSTRTSSQSSSETKQQVGESSQSSVRTRTSGSVGIESRERTGVSVRSRTTVREEPSVSVRRRSVSVVEDDEPSVVVKKKRPAQKVVIKKKKPSSKVVVRSRTRRVVEDEPSVSIRRRTVRTIEQDEPSVSVRSRTSVRSGVNVERQNIRSSTSVRQQSNDTNVSSSTQQRSNVETTGSVSGGSRGSMERSQGSDMKTDKSGEGGGDAKRMLQRPAQGGSSAQPQ